MSYSDIVGTISGLLQFVVACYALRVSRIFGLARVGWVFFGAFSMMALVHLLLSVRPFGIKLELGPGVNILYEVISVLLLTNIGQMEAMLWNRRRQEKKETQSKQAEVTAVQQLVELNKVNSDLVNAHEELQRTATGLQAELALQKQAQEQQQKTQQQHSQEEVLKAEKIFEVQLAAARQSEETLRAAISSLEAEVVQSKAAEAQQQQAQAEVSRAEAALQEQLANTRQSEEQLRATTARLEAELIQQKLLQAELARQMEEQTDVIHQPEPALSAQDPNLPEAIEKLHQVEAANLAYREQLAAARQSEEQLRTTMDELQNRFLEQQQKQEQVENTYRDLVVSLRQSGISEVATIAQSRVAYITRLTNLMREHNRDLGKFMTRNPRGKQLPQSLALLLDYLSDEQFLLIKRIDSVKKKLDRINLSTPLSVLSTTGTSASPEPASVVPVLVESTPSLPTSPATDLDNTLLPGPVPGNDPGDFLEHLIENVTETGTESATHEPVMPEVPDAPLPRSGGFPKPA